LFNEPASRVIADRLEVELYEFMFIPRLPKPGVDYSAAIAFLAGMAGGLLPVLFYPSQRQDNGNTSTPGLAARAHSAC
jgi:hypothetical protein